MVLIGIIFDFTSVLEMGTIGIAVEYFIENSESCVEVLV